MSQKHSVQSADESLADYQEDHGKDGDAATPRADLDEDDGTLEPKLTVLSILVIPFRYEAGHARMPVAGMINDHLPRCFVNMRVGSQRPLARPGTLL
ncbi:hypothetical protein GR211_29900 [Rhizobium leguminosarum]|uniref:hypothetical protein n=1 Tax=Rhizobium ruizarguesonis TaxID=2081791 RepID=UPI0013BACBC1|nr:hypothetical protein [Rhizobium ruizarguesonis]NEJ17153.1 hypothetical protein [Rhizobium ruizarguesonis]NEK31074.1 hypothetical protein [Rhizobium ruizarguesonis]